MKNIFLAAKHLAIRDNSKEITKKHLIEALKGFVPVDVKAMEKVLELLGVKDIERKPLFSSEDLKEAERHSRIEFSKEIKEFKNQIEQQGISLNTNIASLIINKVSNLKRLVEIERLKENLKKDIYMQDVAIEVVCDKLVETQYIRHTDAPKAVFFFLGPPATGKTYLAEKLGEYLEGYSVKVFDMSSYASSNQGFALFGLSRGYHNAEEGKLTRFIKQHKKVICVFDEIEKAHRAIQSNFLQVLSRGRYVDEYLQEEIDCRESIFIFTSNLGSEIYSNNNFLRKLKDDYADAQNIILEAISREMRLTDVGLVPALSPEFISRLSQGGIVLFNKLGYEAFQKIARENLLKYAQAFNDEFGIDINFEAINEVVALKLLTMCPMIDARRVKKRLAFEVFDKVTDYLRNLDLTNLDECPVTKVSFLVESTSSLNEFMSFDDANKTVKIHEMFRKNSTFTVETSVDIKEDKEMIVKFTNPQEVKLPKAKDFAAEEGSLIFEIPTISFADIAGHTRAKERLKEIVGYLKAPQELSKFDIEVPRGMLLYGPPGTGKTMLAKAFANEADLPFIATTGTELLNLDLMKKIFRRAKDYAPSIVFIDELDAIGYRDGGIRDAIINQLLTEVSGFSDEDRNLVFIIAATNFKEKIDPALLRSGRLDMHIKIETLDREARGYFIDKIISKTTQGINREKIITFTAGMTGADLEKVVRESALETIRKGLKELNEEVLIEQINIVKYGERLQAKMLEKITEATAYHEAGHAVVSKVLMPDLVIEQITVTPRRDVLGFVSYNVEDEIRNLTFEDIKNKMCVAFAGRVAQVKRFQGAGIDTGASNDLKLATRLAYYAVAIAGMDEEVGYINIEGGEKAVEDTLIKKRVALLLRDEKGRTEALVEQHWQKIEKVAKELISKEYIDSKELDELLKGTS